jgi:hypothetical protein
LNAVVPKSEVSHIIADRWKSIAAQAGLVHALYYHNPTKEEFSRRKLEAVYRSEQVETLMRPGGNARAKSESTDISGLTANQRAMSLIRRHRSEIRQQIAAATIQYMSTPPDSPLGRLFVRYLKAVQRDLSQLVCPNPAHRHCRAVIAMNSHQEREEIEKLVLEAALAAE